MVHFLSQWKINARFVWITEKRDGPVKVTEVPAAYTVTTHGAGARQLHTSGLLLHHSFGQRCE